MERQLTPAEQDPELIAEQQRLDAQHAKTLAILATWKAHLSKISDSQPISQDQLHEYATFITDNLDELLDDSNIFEELQYCPNGVQVLSIVDPGGSLAWKTCVFFEQREAYFDALRKEDP